MNTDERASTGLTILSKADAIVSLLERKGELSVAQIAEAVDEPLSSTYRLLSALRRIAWVERGVVRGGYRLGLTFMQVGALVEERLDIRAAAIPALMDLRSRTGASAALCVRRASRAVSIELIEGGHVGVGALGLGDSLPLYSGAAARTLFAHLPFAEQEALLDEFAALPSGGYIPSPGEMRRRLVGDRLMGYAISDGEVIEGVAEIAAPVFNHRGELEAVISASGLRSHLLGPTSHVTQKVLRAAAIVSRTLGFEGLGENL